MRPQIAYLPRLIVAVLLLQTVLAPAHCLANAATGGFATAICGGEGKRILHLTASGDIAPDRAAASGFCAACHALPAPPVFAVPVLPQPAWVMVPIAWRHAAPGLLSARARAPPFEATGPPVLA